MSVNFERDSVKYMLAISPTPYDKKVFAVHLNAHLGSNVIPDDSELKKQLVSQFAEFRNTLQTL